MQKNVEDSTNILSSPRHFVHQVCRVKADTGDGSLCQLFHEEHVFEKADKENRPRCHIT